MRRNSLSMYGNRGNITIFTNLQVKCGVSFNYSEAANLGICGGQEFCPPEEDHRCGQIPLLGL